MPNRTTTTAISRDKDNSMDQILVYGDSLSWGIIPGTRERLPFSKRWPGVLEAELQGKQKGRESKRDATH
ncbi:MAG: hypothetical protein KDB03_26555 [Planctomycetales bacterium]|nr:hypothetical protein [Planctomycetales bacterium]